jgi:hypothetical protein
VEGDAMTLHRLELRRGPGHTAPSIVKHTIRFCRRLREHGIYHYDTPAAVDSDHGCNVIVGKRVVLIHPEGDIRQALKPHLTVRGWMFDPKAMPAYNARYHAIWMDMAATSRRQRWLIAARKDLALASHARQSS